MNTQEEAQRRALEAHTERAIGRAVLAAAQTPETWEPSGAALESTTRRAVPDGAGEVARLTRELGYALTARDAAQVQALAACKDVASLKETLETAERSAKAAREARDQSEAKLRDAIRDAQNVGERLHASISERERVAAELQNAIAERDSLSDELNRVRNGEMVRTAVSARELARVKQALDAANEEMNRLRLAGRAS